MDYWFDQSMDELSMPAVLTSLTSWRSVQSKRRQSESARWPPEDSPLAASSTRAQQGKSARWPTALHFWATCFDQSMDKLSLPAVLRNPTFGGQFSQSMVQVSRPTGLQSFTFCGKLYPNGASASHSGISNWNGNKVTYVGS